MKLKEINRTAIQSWSPAEHHPIYLATGTSAQQLDASFSTNACLEFFELDLAEPSVDMKLCGSFSSTHRYHKLVWGPSEINDDGHPAGVLTAGGENGNVILYNPAKIIAGESDVIIAESNRHSGPVRALDINPFQTNLVASGGNESEIYIWDMNNFDSPMTPGPKTQPLEDISCISWNRQVQHILASASPSGRASVWDLRKNDLIIKVSDHSNRMHCSGLAWNPEVATQLVLASEDDRMPVIQMWDLRFATSPLKIFENHTRGILSIAWNLADPELLLSCGKDSRILCWNPNTAEVLYELPTSNQWCFDIQWCPRNPAVLSAAGFDGHIDIYSIMGGSSQAQSQRHADQISTSFGNMDPFGTGQTLPPMQLPQTSIPAALVNPLKKPPKWIRRPVGASFAFGGKLVSLENGKPNPQQPEQPISYTVHISQVVTETALLKRSDQLQATLTAGSILDFCQGKIVAAENESEKTIWSFLKVNFESEIRCKFLELLGYNKEELALKISAALEAKTADPPKVAMPAAVSLQPLPDLSLLPLADTPEAAFDMIAASNQPAATLELDSLPAGESETPAVKAVDPDNDLLTSEPEESGDQILSEGEAEEEIPLEETSAPMEEEPSPAKTSVPTEEATTAGGFSLNISEDVDGLITQALLTGDFEGAVDLCLHDNRMADSIILAIAGGAELMEKTQKKYFTKTHSKITKLISAVVMKDLRDILKTCDLQNWKEALAAVMTYAKPDEFSPLCDLLGGRLETSEFTELQYQACLCYICSGNVEKLVTCLSKALEKHSPLSLQNLVEKVVVLHRAVEQTRRSCPSAVNIILAKLMSQYATLLASQGSLSSALAYLPDNTNQIATQNLHDRLSCALRQQEMAPIGNQRAQSQLPAYQAKHNSGMPCCPITAVQLTMMPQPNAAAPGPMFTPPSAPAPAQLQYYQPVRAASTVTSWSNQTPTALPNVPPSLQVGSASDQQVEPSNSMYMMPTSATSVAPAIPSTPAYMYSQQYQPYPQVNQYPPGAMGSAFYQPLQHSYSPAETTSTSRLPGFLPQYTQPTLFQPAPPFYPGQPPISHCQSFSSPSHPPFFATVASSSAPLSSKASFQHGGPGSPVSYMPLPPPCEVSGTQHDPDPELTLTTQITGPQNGWNDPPALNRASKKKQVPENYSPPVPITAPIMGPLSADGQCSGAPPTMFQGPHGTQSLYSGMQQQQISPLTMNSTIPKTSMEGAPGAPTGDVIQPLQAIPPEKIMKKPIPDEHIILKTTFEGLIQKCLSVATDPQTKRKLDEANKRLEALYDKLREQTLSPAIVGGLHNIATTIEARSYIEGLTIHTRIVSNSNFSETSAFMPVLKVVLTQANKLGV